MKRGQLSTTLKDLDENSILVALKTGEDSARYQPSHRQYPRKRCGLNLAAEVLIYNPKKLSLTPDKDLISAASIKQFGINLLEL